nr:40S ribosomal protein S17-like [Aedes albopictus]
MFGIENFQRGTRCKRRRKQRKVRWCSRKYLRVFMVPIEFALVDSRLTMDFHIVEEEAIIPTKPLRNKIAVFRTHLKLQEEERKRGDNCVPEVSSELDIIEVDPETRRC